MTRSQVSSEIMALQTELLRLEARCLDIRLELSWWRLLRAVLGKSAADGRER